MPLFRPLNMDDIKEDERYRNAKIFQDDFDPSENKQYKWIYDYSISMLKNANDSIAQIDGKVEHMVRYVGSGAGILGIGFGLFSSGVVGERCFIYTCFNSFGDKSPYSNYANTWSANY
jgi:hypothetical protein